MPTSRRPDRLVVDANPILSALLGGQARRVFFESGVREFAVPAPVLAEVREYLPRLAQKLGVAPALLDLAVDLFPLRPYGEGAYRGHLTEARRRIGQRDPDDVPALALALRLGIPLWSNDRDFERAGVEQLTTARLLRLLFGPSTPT